MTDWTVLAILAAMMVMGSVASNSANDYNDQWTRYSWGGMGCGLLLAMAMPNPWLALCVGVMVLGLVTVRPRSRCYREIVSQGLVWVAAYLAVYPLLKLWMIPWIFGMFVLVGCIQGAWCLYSVFTHADAPDGSYNRQLARGIWVYDRDIRAPLAGQGNFNHGHSIAALALAANVGLLWLGHFWTVLMMPLVACPLYFLGEYWRQHPSQGWAHAGSLAVAVTLLCIPPSAACILLVCLVCGTLWIAKPWNPRLGWIDSGRLWLWKEAIVNCWWTALQPRDAVEALKRATETLEQVNQQWAQVQQQMASLTAVQPAGVPIEWSPETWKVQQTLQQQHFHLTQNIREYTVLAKRQQGEAMTPDECGVARALAVRRWRTRLLGFGTGSFYTVTLPSVLKQFGKFDAQQQKYNSLVFLHAHNEFVQMLTERGIVGFVALCGLVGSALWMTFTGGVTGQAVFLLVATWVSVALLNFPMSIFHEYGHDPNPAQQQFMGSPALTMLTFGVAVLAGMFV